MMLGAEGQDAGEVELDFEAHNSHDPSCGRPPRLRNTDNPGLYHGYFENYFGEQFVFTFDRSSGTGTISGGDLDWGNSKTFTLSLLEEVLRSTQSFAAQIVGLGRTAESDLPIIDSALALSRLTGLTGKDEVIWLRACLTACTVAVGTSEGGQAG